MKCPKFVNGLFFNERKTQNAEEKLRKKKKKRMPGRNQTQLLPATGLFESGRRHTDVATKFLMSHIAIMRLAEW